jgi:hypothetical protein
VGPQFAPIDFAVYAGQVEEQVLDASSHQFLREPGFQIRGVRLAPIPLDVTIGAAKDHGRWAMGLHPFIMGFQGGQGHDPVVSGGFWEGVDEQGWNEKGEVAGTGKGIDGLEFIPHVFTGLRMGAVCVGIEGDIPEVDTASLRQGANPPI